MHIFLNRNSSQRIRAYMIENVQRELFALKLGNAMHRERPTSCYEAVTKAQAHVVRSANHFVFLSQTETIEHNTV